MAAWHGEPVRRSRRTSFFEMRLRDWLPLAVVAVACFLVVAFNVKL
jgi:hypothetical protein